MISMPATACSDQYGDQKLDLAYIANSNPLGYKSCLSPWSNRNRGMIFIFPPSAPYGCPFGERDRYDEAKHLGSRALPTRLPLLREYSVFFQPEVQQTWAA
jgi:hypothetical protein